jgi:hypothetical protein
LRFVKNTKKIFDQLKKDGLLDEFIKARTFLQKEMVTFLEPHFPIEKNLVHEITLHLKGDQIGIERVDSRLIEASGFYPVPTKTDEWGYIEPLDSSSFPAIRQDGPHKVIAYWYPRRYGFAPFGEEGTLEQFRKYGFVIYTECMQFLFTAKYGN